MRPAPNERVEQGRVRKGRGASDASYGMNGWFSFRCDVTRAPLSVIASNGGGWEHVSVSTRGRCPVWEEMCWVKDLFWSEEECVVQYHPPASVYVTFHPHVLHLWRPVMGVIPTPPTWMIGPLGRTVTP